MRRVKPETRWRILIDDQVRLRIATHRFYIHLKTPAASLIRRSRALIDEYLSSPLAGVDIHTLQGSLAEAVRIFRAEVYDHLEMAYADTIQIAHEGILSDYRALGIHVPDDDEEAGYSAKSGDGGLPSLPTDWRRPFHPLEKVDETIRVAPKTGPLAEILMELGWGVESPASRSLLEQPLILAGKYSDELQRRMQFILSKGVERGESTQVISKRLMRGIPGMTYGAARRIAWTETHNTMNFFKFEEYMRDEVIERVQWISVGDKRVRPSHYMNHLQVVVKGEEFRNGQRYPGDRMAPIREWIHCRCTLTPYIIDPDVPAAPRTRSLQNLTPTEALTPPPELGHGDSSFTRTEKVIPPDLLRMLGGEYPEFLPRRWADYRVEAIGRRGKPVKKTPYAVAARLTGDDLEVLVGPTWRLGEQGGSVVRVKLDDPVLGEIVKEYDKYWRPLVAQKV